MKLGGNRGGGKTFPQPDSKKPVAVLAAVYDVGIQRTNYMGEDRESERVALIWELEEQMPDGGPFVMMDEVSASLFRSSKLREAAEALLDRPVEEDEEIDSADLIGKSAVLTLVPGKGKNADKRYVNKREGLQDKSRSLEIQGSYGPEDEMPYLVHWKMQRAIEGTVPPNQGLAPKRKRKQEAAPEGAPEDPADDIPF